MRDFLDSEYLSHLSLFRDLTPDQLSDLKQSLTVFHYPPKKEVIPAGIPGGAVYIICEGWAKVQIQQKEVDKVIILAILGPGQTVGEMALAGKFNRSASVIALTEID